LLICKQFLKLFKFWFNELHAASLGVPKQTHKLEKISILIDAYPEALMKANRDGWTPLRLALLYLNASSDIIQLLLERSPAEVLGMRDKGGFTSGAILRSSATHQTAARPFLPHSTKSLCFQIAKKRRVSWKDLIASARRLVCKGR
jgi:hypothetical protein